MISDTISKWDCQYMWFLNLCIPVILVILEVKAKGHPQPEMSSRSAYTTQDPDTQNNKNSVMRCVTIW